MATEISAVFNPASVTQLAFHPAVEPRTVPAPAHAEEHAQHIAVLDSKEIKYAVEQMNEFAKVVNHRLSFSIDQETHDIIVKVVDADTDKVIRELPPAELQKLHKSIKEALGLLIDKLI